MDAEEVFNAITGTFMLILCFALIAIVPYLADGTRSLPKPRRRKQYQEYATEPFLADNWHNSELQTSTCSACGGPDAIRFSRCKWCSELLDLTVHLKERSSKRAKRQFERRMR